ncbi:MAG: DMT family transporter [Burkholderiaceae bacterium]|nr:DMT family transporter [Burkholderiaceae bacterium]
MKPGQWLLLVATAASFASSILIGKILIGTLPPLTLAAMRVLLAAPLCFGLLLAFHRDLPRTRADRRTAVAASLGVIVIPYCCLAIGQQTIPSGLSGILYSMMPLFTLLVAHFVLHDERLGLRKVAGIGVGIAGVVAVIGPSLLGGLGQHAIAELITLCGPLAYAFGTVLMRRSRPIDPIGLTTAMFLTATLVLLPLALIVEQPWQVRGGGLLVVELIALAIVGTILPAALNYVLVQQVGATRASVAMFLMPLIAVLFGVVFLDERLTLHALLGMGLILIGSLVVNGLGRDASAVPAPVAGAANPPIG